MTEEMIRIEIEKSRVRDTIVAGLNAVDRHDWAKQRSTLADEVVIDFGGVRPAQPIRADDLVAWAKNAHGKMNLTQHMSFNHEIAIDGDKARSYSYGQTLHQHPVSVGEDFWHLYARYEHDLRLELDGWKITRIKMTPVYQLGNSNIIDQVIKDEAAKQNSSPNE